jgi:hypothetical protein
MSGGIHLGPAPRVSFHGADRKFSTYKFVEIAMFTGN